MTDSKAAAAGVALIAAVGAHSVGALRVAEREISPSLAKASLNIFNVTWDNALPAARGALKEKLSGSSDDQIVARAACAVINTNMSASRTKYQFEQAISDRVYGPSPFVQRNVAVDKAIDYVATRLAGVTDFHRLYLDACYRKY